MTNGRLDFTRIPVEDTLLAQHSIASHFPKRLDWVVTEYTDSGPWKLKHGRRGGGQGEEKGGLAPVDMHPDERAMYCVAEGTPVVLEDGSTQKIEKIVRNRLPIKVLSLNGAGQIEAKAVVAWHQNKVLGQQWIRLQTEVSQVNPHNRGLVVTPDHLVHTNRGWSEAQYVRVGDEVAISERQWNFLEEGALIGTLLGDSTLAVSPCYRKRRHEAPFASLAGGHKQDSKLVKYKTAAIPDVLMEGPTTDKYGFEGSTPFTRMFSRNGVQFARLVKKLYLVDGTRVIPYDILDRLGPSGWAWWFMDDGCRQNVKSGADHVCLSMLRYSKEVREVVRSYLGRFGRIGLSTAGVILFSPEASWKFCEYIAPYVFPSVRYKLSKQQEWAPWVPQMLTSDNVPVYVRVTSKDSYVPVDVGRHKTREHRYCLTVEGNNNFFTSYGLVHNCAADTRLTIRTWKAMQGDLAPVRHIYEHDKKLGVLCRNMTVAGILLDETARQKLSARLKAKEEECLEKMRALCGPTFNPQKPAALREALFGSFAAPVLKRTETGLSATDKGVLVALSSQASQAGELARTVLVWKGAAKLRSTYVMGSKKNPIETGADGRVHASWRSFGTVSGRLSCRKPALQIIPPECRRMYVAAAGSKFVYFDVGQAEMRFAAYLSEDATAIAEIEGGDCYLGSALTLFGADPTARAALTGPNPKVAGKFWRQAAKVGRLAANYMIDADNLYPKFIEEGLNIDYKTTKFVLDKIHSSYRRYFRFVEDNVLLCQHQGFLEDPILGRKRRLGFFPGAPDCANYPIQSGIAAVMNERLMEIDMCLGNKLGVIVAQIHDAAVIETPEGNIEAVKDVVREVWSKPVRLKNDREFVLPIDLKIGCNLAEFE